MTRNAKVMTSRTVEEDDLGSQLPALPVPISPGFWISERTLRHMVSGGEMTALRERIVAELASLEHAAMVGHPYPKQGSGRGAKHPLLRKLSSALQGHFRGRRRNAGPSDDESDAPKERLAKFKPEPCGAAKQEPANLRC